PILETIEITFFPKLASAQKEDIAESIEYLERKIKEVEERVSRESKG
ncbi:MAG: hydrogenase expression/formation protein, partial [Aquificae bacterium]|nr:hydrogenase expression/formation protein [Aquificota bacterium]